MTEARIKEIKDLFKGRGRISAFSLRYLNDTKFFVNKQFDNKNFCVVTTTSGKSESVIGLFRTKKAAVEFGVLIGLEEIPAPVMVEPTFNI